jgi:hypothetical protein
MADCGFPFTPDCNDLLNWFVLLLGGILACAFFLWQWNIRSLRRNYGQAKIILNLIDLKEKLEEYKSSISDFFDGKITAEELAKQKGKQAYHINQLNFAISISHDTMKSGIISKIEMITELASWETIDNRDVALENASHIIRKINEIEEKYLKKQFRYTRQAMIEVVKKNKS